MLIITSLFIFLLSVIGGVAYRMGGSGRYPRYFRELGQGLCFVLVFILLALVPFSLRPILGLILGFGVCWAESTYYKKSGTDTEWWNWLLVGVTFGVVSLPYCIITNSHWIGFGIRFFTCSGLTLFWEQYFSQIVCDEINSFLTILKRPLMGKDITDEFGRGFINIITLPLLLIGG